MAVTKLTEEFFGTYKTYNAANPGGLGAITTGAMNAVLGGASKTAGANGFALSITGAFQSQYETTSYSSGTDVCMCFWVNVGALPGSTKTLALIYNGGSLPSSGGPGVIVQLLAAGNLYLYTDNQTVTSAGTLSANTSYFVIVRMPAGLNKVATVFFGTSVANAVAATGTTAQSVGTLTNEYIGFGNGGGVDTLSCRVSGFRAFSMLSTDAISLIGTACSDMVAPPAFPLTVHFGDNGAGGGDGSAAAPLTYIEACQYAPFTSPSISGITHYWERVIDSLVITPSNFTALELEWLAINGYIVPNPLLDTWILDVNTTITEDGGGVAWLFNPGGLVILNGNSHTIAYTKTINMSGAINYTGTTNVWQIAAPAGSVLYEDGKMMNRVVTATSITGTNGTLNGVNVGSQTTAQLIGGTPGTFFNDGTNLYFSTFENATTLGAVTSHTWTRGYGGAAFSTGLGGGNVAINGSVAVFLSSYAHDLTITGCTITDVDGALLGNWSSALDNSDFTYVNNITVIDWNDHAIGINTSASNGRVAANNITLGRTTPTVGNSSGFWNDSGLGVSAAFVAYNANSSATGNQFALNNVVVTGEGSIGSATAAVANGTAILSHNSGGSGQFSMMVLTNSPSIAGSIGTGNTVSSVLVSNASATNMSFFSGTVRNSITTNGLILASNQTSTSLVTITNCVEIANGQHLNQTIFDGTDRNHCTLDFTNANSESTNGFALITNGGTSAARVRNCLIIGHTADTHSVNVYNAFTSAFLDSDYNVYVPSSSQYFAYNYNDGTSGYATRPLVTLANWQQTTGQDAHSVQIATAAALLLDANYYPLVGSPLIGAASDGGNIGAKRHIGYGINGSGILGMVI